MALCRASVLVSICFLFVFASFTGATTGAAPQAQKKPVIIPGKTFLPLRVLARPNSNIYQEPKEGSPIVEENVPVFQNYFVYTRPEGKLTDTQAKGWFEVGSDQRGKVLGWMKAEDVMEWKQTMCLAYTHPGDRKPVLMFDDLEAIRSMVMMPTEERTQKAKDCYSAIDTKKIPENFPVISMEPKDAVDITEKFYLMPIIEHSPIFMDEREGRLLKIASAPKTGRGEDKISDEGAAAVPPTAEKANDKLEAQGQTAAVIPAPPQPNDSDKAGDAGDQAKTAAVTAAPPANDSEKASPGSAPNPGEATKETTSPEAQPAAKPADAGEELEKTAQPNDVEGNPEAQVPPNIETGKAAEPAQPEPDPLEGGAADPDNPEAAIGQKMKSLFSTEENKEALKNLKLDVVYVVDMTASMQKHIDATLKSIEDMTAQITGNEEITKAVRFGLWGYRDSMEIPDIGFHTKNFTPELQDVTSFKSTLGAVKVAQVGSVDYEEDVFSGVDKAMRETQWTDKALRFIVLLGDAPGHEPGQNWNSSGQSAETLRSFANDNQFYIFSFHIKDPKAEKYWAKAEEQFKVLATNKGSENPIYHSVVSTDLDAFTRASKEVAGGLVALVDAGKKGAAPEAPKTAETGAAPAEGGEETKEVAAKVQTMGYAALVEWIGREKGAEAPRDIVAWVIDKDLIDPAIDSLEVRVLVSKNQIDSLRTVLQELMAAGRRGMISGEKFFDALQAIPAVASRAGDQIKSATSLVETGLVPEFMTDLPYESQIMGMSNEVWSSWGQDQQETFLNEVDAKIKLYTAIHDNPKGWVALNQGDEPGENVYALSLEDLP